MIFVAGTEMEFDNFTVSPFATLGNHTRKNITSDDIYFHKVKVYCIFLNHRKDDIFSSQKACDLSLIHI